MSTTMTLDGIRYFIIISLNLIPFHFRFFPASNVCTYFENNNSSRIRALICSAFIISDTVQAKESNKKCIQTHENWLSKEYK